MHNIVHWEIPVKDIKRAKAFYGAVFGWTFQDYGKTYAMFTTPGGGVGGGFTKVKKVPTKPVINVYIGVDDIQAKVKQIKKARGKVLSKKSEIPNMGWWVKFADNQGAVLFLFQAARRPGQTNLPM